MARGDFTGDSRSDIVLQSPTGAIRLWGMDGALITSTERVSQTGTPVNAGQGWDVVQSGDFNGDSLADLLWRGPDGEVTIWDLDGPRLLAEGSVLRNGHPVNPGHNWTIMGTGDFNGDGMTDVLWRSTAEAGALHIWSMDGNDIVSNHPARFGGGPVNVGSEWSVEGTGDFGGDGKSDVLWRSDAGEIATWDMDGFDIASSGLISQQGSAVTVADQRWKVSGTGDFNGDGMTDILWRGPDGAVGVWLLDDRELLVASVIEDGGQAVKVNARWDVVGTGDYTGDGQDDILWQRPDGAAVLWTLDGSQLQSSRLVHDDTDVVKVADRWQIAPTT